MVQHTFSAARRPYTVQHIVCYVYRVLRSERKFNFFHFFRSTLSIEYAFVCECGKCRHGRVERRRKKYSRWMPMCTISFALCSFILIYDTIRHIVYSPLDERCLAYFRDEHNDGQKTFSKLCVRRRGTRCENHLKFRLWLRRCIKSFCGLILQNYW